MCFFLWRILGKMSMTVFCQNFNSSLVRRHCKVVGQHQQGPGQEAWGQQPCQLRHFTNTALMHFLKKPNFSCNVGKLPVLLPFIRWEMTWRTLRGLKANLNPLRLRGGPEERETTSITVLFSAQESTDPTRSSREPYVNGTSSHWNAVDVRTLDTFVSRIRRLSH